MAAIKVKTAVAAAIGAILVVGGGVKAVQYFSTPNKPRTVRDAMASDAHSPCPNSIGAKAATMLRRRARETRQQRGVRGGIRQEDPGGRDGHDPGRTRPAGGGIRPGDLVGCGPGPGPRRRLQLTRQVRVDGRGV